MVTNEQRMPVSDLQQLIHTIDPVLHEGVYVFASVDHRETLKGVKIIASIEESEGLSVVLREEDALGSELAVLFRAVWITLTVNSDLEAVGLTAVVAGALARAGISCNVVAGAFHDHLFVPVDKAEAAMQALKKLQVSSAS